MLVFFLCLTRHIFDGRRDVRIWKAEAKGRFSDKSFYNLLIGVGDRMVGWKRFWNPVVPPRILVFSWVARLHKILTMDQLRKRNFIVVNGCPLCLQDEETKTHLLVHCNYAQTVSTSILRIFLYLLGHALFY